MVLLMDGEPVDLRGFGYVKVLVSFYRFGHVAISGSDDGESWRLLHEPLEGDDQFAIELEKPPNWIRLDSDGVRVATAALSDARTNLLESSPDR